MHHALGMGMGQCAGHPGADVQHLGLGQQASGLGVAAEIGAAHPFHRHPGMVAAEAGIQHGDDIGVFKAPAQIGLSAQAGQPLLALWARQVGRQGDELDGDRVAGAQVCRFVDLAVAAFGNQRADPESAGQLDGFAVRCGRHGPRLLAVKP